MSRSVAIFIRKAAFAGACILISSSLHAATVRGQLVRNTPKGRVPAAGISVTVKCQSGRSPVSHSGADGMYYIANVPSGNCTLEIWVNAKSPMQFPTTVVEPNTDIPPVIVP